MNDTTATPLGSTLADRAGFGGGVNLNNMNTNQAIALRSFANQFQFSAGMTFGPLWNDPATVIKALYDYANSEGHSTNGKTVLMFAEQLQADHYGASGEEIRAIIRAMQLGLHDEVISVRPLSLNGQIAS
jgi:hypothetical protein